MFIQGEKFEQIADNKKIFYRHTPDVNEFLRNPPKDDFILVSHNSDGKITDKPKEYDADIRLIPDNLIKWYGQNVNYKHNKIESVPIGLENSKWFPQINKRKQMLDKIKTNKQIKNLLYLNHNIRTNYNERAIVYKLLKDKKWTTSENGMNGNNFSRYIDNIYNHKFIICPEGNGTDTHRTWEALYLDTIPIEKRNINNSFYSDLPICFVDDWSDITEEFLVSEYKRITETKWNLEKLTMDYWIKKIKLSEYK